MSADLLGPKPKIDPDALARIRGWAHTLWALAGDASVVVSELRCSEPGCPPVETVVLVARQAGETFQIKLAMPAADVTFTDLQGAADAHCC
jgi:hypothetical protein